MFRILSLSFGIYTSVAALIAVWVYFDALETALESDRQAGRVRLSEATSRLRGQLDIYKALVNIVAKDPKTATALSAALNQDDRAKVSLDLSLLELTYGASEVDLVDQNKTVIAASSQSNFGYVYSNNVIRSAFNGRLGYAVEVDDGERLVRFSRGVLDNNAKTVGVVVVTVNLATLEFEWPLTPEPIVFFDSAGRSISSNRPGLLLLSNADGAIADRFPLEDQATLAGAPVSTFISTEGMQSEVQTLNLAIPQLQLTGQILLDTKSARSIALLRLGLALALLFALGLVGAIFVQQRRRLALESRHSTTLEQRVEERTAELREAQNELVEASNLAALGRLSAGVSHELNQPLAAILNFAENGKRLLEKSRTKEASDNLSQIADQVRRITRIISNLRAFSRQENLPTEQVDLCGVVNRAVGLMQADIKKAGVKQKIAIPTAPLYVTAGKLRLEQVVLNLVSNALDAMQSSSQKVITIQLEDHGKMAVLTVQDSGTGIDDPARVFEPFYTTKELGASKGLGMGLALSFGLVSHFGGQLTCQNLKQGAEFKMSLPQVGASQ